MQNVAALFYILILKMALPPPIVVIIESVLIIIIIIIIIISSVSGDDREGHFLFQRLSVILQRYNAVLLHESFVQSDGLDL